MKLLNYIAGILALSSASLCALDIPNELALSGGYRHDNTYFVDRSIQSGVHSADKFKVPDLNVWQIGLKGRFFFPHLDCLCNYNFLSNFYIAGHAYWGKAFGTKSFTERADASDDSFIHSAGKLKSYNTRDFKVGLGYLFDLSCLNNCCANDYCGSIFDFFSDLKIGVTGGWSYNRQRLKTKYGETVIFDGVSSFTGIDPDPFYAAPGLQIGSRWSGGYVGVELFKRWDCNILTNLGYEHHFVHFNGFYRPSPFGLTEAISLTKRDREAHGDVIYLNSSYIFCNGIEIGSEFQWSYYSAHKVREHIVSTPVTGVTPRKSKAVWQSYALTLNLGYAF